MLSLFYKLFKESFQLVDYISSYYLSNIVIITFLQLLVIYYLYNVYTKIKKNVIANNKNILVKNYNNLIKNILVSYHQEQIGFIERLFDNETVQELFMEKIFNNVGKIIPANNNTPDINTPDVYDNELEKDLDKELEKDLDKELEKDLDKELEMELDNDEHLNKYPKLPDSPVEDSD
jgi:hypothetical protein